MKHANLYILIGAMLATSAQAQTTRNMIYEYGGYQAPTTNYVIDNQYKTIEIKSMWFPGGVYCSSPSAATYRFKFDARTEKYEGGQWVDDGPGDINSITLHPSANNPCVIIEINGNPNNNHVYGADHVKEIDLPTYLTARTELWRTRISGDLGTTYLSTVDYIGMTEVGGDLNGSLSATGDITGSVTIDGNLSAGAWIWADGTLCSNVTIEGDGPHAGTIGTESTLTASISVGGDMIRPGSIRVQNAHAQADITIDGDMSGYIKIGGNLTGDITVNGNMEADSGYDGWTYLWVVGDIATTSDVEIKGNMGGFVRVDGDLEGSIDVDGDLIRNTWYDETFIVNGDLSGSANIGNDCLGDMDLHELSGSLSFGGDVNRSIDITGTSGPMTGLVHVGGDITGAVGRVRGAAGLSGKVLIDGKLAKSGQNVRFADPVTSTGAIAVDYDGWHSTDDAWEAGAYITVDGTDYSGNAFDYRVYKITRCKGDMDNNGSVDFDDVDPFVAALSDPDPDDFEAAYPGRGGSMLYHGDIDCDSDIDFDDVDPFVARIGQACVGCPERDGGGGGQLSPLELARELAIHIAPQRYDDLCDIIAAVAQRQRNAERAAYWTAVWEYLCD